MEYDTLTIAKAAEALKKKSVSSEDLVKRFFRRMDACEPSLNAVLYRSEESALTAARESDARRLRGETRGQLDGVPMLIKDTITVRGMPATAGSRILRGYQPPFHATVIERLLKSGAILLGKTNCDEFAMGASGENSSYGATKNPWNLDRVPGGSSSGSAAAVAAGECCAALGSDTGGSIRQPAGFCNIVGLKPTYGRVSRYGLIALASSLDCIGPLTRTVDDAALLLNVIAGYDAADATSVEQPPVDLSTVHAGEIRGLRVGIPKEYFIDGMDADVERIVRAAIPLLEKNGAIISEVSLPHTNAALAAYYIILPAEASSNLARYDGIRYGVRASGVHDLRETYGRSRDEGLGDEPKRRIMLGTYALSAGYYDAYYLKAQKVRTLIRKDFSDVFRSVDVLLTPTSPSLPFKLGERFADPLTMYLSDIFTVPADIAGIPGVSIPAGWGDGLPIGVQLMGPMWSEERVLTAARALERELSIPLRLPSVSHGA
ncbi:MAG: Asp-tRNA(Asn)/Glu-tRNA(Gln) amidotransferase subunit GatA [bacterium]